MNGFFVIGGELYTAAAAEDHGTILPGVTRRSVIELAKDWGIPVHEGRISIDTITEASRNGRLEEVFATGTAAAPFMRYLLEQASAWFPALRGQVIAVENDFFGHTIDVAGLLTGQDLSAQLQKVPDLGRVLLPLHMLRHGENVFLDDYTVDRLSAELGCPVQIVGIDGGDLLDAMLDREE